MGSAAHSRDKWGGYVVARGLVRRWVGANCVEKMDSRFRGKDGWEVGLIVVAMAEGTW